MRKMIDKVKTFKTIVNESYYGDYISFNDEYFMKRVPFFKTFENNSNGEKVIFNYKKKWSGDDSAILHFGKNNGFVEFQNLSVETKFFYWTERLRDFKTEMELPKPKPMWKTRHIFNYSTHIHMDLPNTNDVDEVSKQIVALMVKEMLQEKIKFKDSFDVKDGKSVPKDRLDKIINSINKNLFNVEEVLGKLNVNYF